MKAKDLLDERFGDVEGTIADRRADSRSPVPDAMEVMANHMFNIKRALDTGNIEKAQALVNGAIQAFQKRH